jgi:hypothetical protein
LLKLFINHELDEGFSPIIVWVGLMGRGKTCDAIKVAEDIYPHYDYDIHHTYTLEKYLDAVDVVEPRGVVTFEESGRNLGRSSWWSVSNKIFSEANQTQRYRNFVTQVILPDVSLLATTHMTLVRYLCWATKIGSFTFYRNFRVPIDMRRTLIRIRKCQVFFEVPLPSRKNYNKYKIKDTFEKGKILTQLRVAAKKETEDNSDEGIIG